MQCQTIILPLNNLLNENFVKNRLGNETIANSFFTNKKSCIFLNLTQLLKSFQGRKLNSVFYSEFPSKFLCSKLRKGNRLAPNLKRAKLRTKASLL